MLPLNHIAFLARVVVSFLTICVKMLERNPDFKSKFVYIFSCSSYAYNFLWSRETSYSESSSIWMEISYLLCDDISYFILLTASTLGVGGETLVLCAHSVLNLNQISFYQPSSFVLLAVSLVASLLIQLQRLAFCHPARWVCSVPQQNMHSMCGEFIMFTLII